MNTGSLTTRLARGLLILFTGLTLVACNPFGTSVKAEQTVIAIHSLWDESDFENIYESADDDFKETLSLVEAVEFLQGLRSRLGRVVASEKQSNMVKTTLSIDTTVTLVYATTYENGTATETFIFRTGGGRASLLGWRIDPDDDQR